MIDARTIVLERPVGLRGPNAAVAKAKEQLDSLQDFNALHLGTPEGFAAGYWGDGGSPELIAALRPLWEAKRAEMNAWWAETQRQAALRQTPELEAALRASNLATVARVQEAEAAARYAAEHLCPHENYSQDPPAFGMTPDEWRAAYGDGCAYVPAGTCEPDLGIPGKCPDVAGYARHLERERSSNFFDQVGDAVADVGRSIDATVLQPIAEPFREVGAAIDAAVLHPIASAVTA